MELNAFISVTNNENELLWVVATESCGRWVSRNLLKIKIKMGEIHRDEVEEVRV